IAAFNRVLPGSRFALTGWCGRRDLNPHDFRHGNLNPARLPVPPRPPKGACAAPLRPSGAVYSTRFSRRTRKIGYERAPSIAPPIGSIFALNAMPVDARFTLSLRRFLAAGITVMCAAVPRPARAQEADGFRVLRARPGQVVLRNVPTALDSFDGVVPGPLLRTKRGHELKIRFANDLASAAAIHWHGVRLPNAMDGTPGLTQSPVQIGTNSDYRFAPPDAGTFWYRAMGARTRGLYGPLIVDELEPPRVDRDVLVMLDDWRLHDDGVIDDANGATLLTVNSVPAFDIATNTNERLRLRLINAGARVFALRVEKHDARVMAIDGQPAQPFLARDGRVALAPGNRIDLFVEAAREPGSVASIFADNDGSEIALARLVYGAAPARPNPLPDAKPLPANPLPERINLTSALKVELPIENGSRFFASLPFSAQSPRAFMARPGQAVTLGFVNRANAPRVLHPHGHAFRLLDRLDDGW